MESQEITKQSKKRLMKDQGKKIKQKDLEEEKGQKEDIENAEEEQNQEDVQRKPGCVICGVYDSSKAFSQISCCKAYVHTECFNVQRNNPSHKAVDPKSNKKDKLSRVVLCHACFQPVGTLKSYTKVQSIPLHLEHLEYLYHQVTLDHPHAKLAQVVHQNKILQFKLVETQRRSDKWKTKALRYRETLEKNGIDARKWTEEAKDDKPLKTDPISNRTSTVRYWQYEKHYYFPTDTTGEYRCLSQSCGCLLIKISGRWWMRGKHSCKVPTKEDLKVATRSKLPVAKQEKLRDKSVMKQQRKKR